MPLTIFAIVWSGMSGKLLLAELVEDEVRRVAEVQELEVVLPDAVDALEQPVIGDEQRVGGTDAAALGDDRLVLDLRQVGDLQRVELVDRLLDLRLPAPVELVPVLEVEARALRRTARRAGRSRPGRSPDWRSCTPSRRGPGGRCRARAGRTKMREFA